MPLLLLGTTSLDVEDLLSLPRIQAEMSFPILLPPSSPCCWATFARILRIYCLYPRCMQDTSLKRLYLCALVYADSPLIPSSFGLLQSRISIGKGRGIELLKESLAKDTWLRDTWRLRRIGTPLLAGYDVRDSSLTKKYTTRYRKALCRAHNLLN